MKTVKKQEFEQKKAVHWKNKIKPVGYEYIKNLPYNAVLDIDLTDSDVRLFTMLWHYGQAKADCIANIGTCNLSRQDMADKLGWGLEKTKGCLYRLRDAGYIARIDHRRSYVARYYIYPTPTAGCSIAGVSNDPTNNLVELSKYLSKKEKTAENNLGYEYIRKLSYVACTDRRISDANFRVYAVMWHYGQVRSKLKTDTGTCFLTMGRIAEILSVSVSTIKRYWSHLRTYDYIFRVANRRNNVGRYRLYALPSTQINSQTGEVIENRRTRPDTRLGKSNENTLGVYQMTQPTISKDLDKSKSYKSIKGKGGAYTPDPLPEDNIELPAILADGKAGNAVCVDQLDQKASLERCETVPQVGKVPVRLTKQVGLCGKSEVGMARFKLKIHIGGRKNEIADILDGYLHKFACSEDFDIAVAIAKQNGSDAPERHGWIKQLAHNGLWGWELDRQANRWVRQSDIEDVDPFVWINFDVKNTECACFGDCICHLVDNDNEEY